MKATIELLKNEGLIDKFQKHFNEVKAPKGTPEEDINKSILYLLTKEASKNEMSFQFKLFDALHEDAVEAIRKELNIEFVEEQEFLKSSANVLAELLIKIVRKDEK